MKNDLPARIHAAAHLRGKCRLRSGTISDTCFDNYRIESDPVLLREIAENMVGLLPADADAVAGLELGGVPLVTMIAQVAGLPALFVRKEAKDYGTSRLAEGGDVAGRRLVVIGDVVTSGGQIADSCRRLRALGAVVEVACCVVDRDAGGAANLARVSIELRALLSPRDLDPGSWGGAPFELGAPGPMRDRLLDAVRSGHKVATSAMLAQYEADSEPLPVAGERRVLMDSEQRPAGHVVITEVAVIRLGDADDRLALDEGENFASAREWRAAHEAFWREHVLPELSDDFVLDDDSKIVVERFAVDGRYS